MSEAVTQIVDVRPGKKSLCLKVKVLQSKVISDNAKRAISECLVADESASILFTARGEQCEKMKAGTSYGIQGAKVEMYKGSMRLSAAADVAITETTAVNANKKLNMSQLEFETVIVAAANEARANGAAAADGAAAAANGAAATNGAAPAPAALEASA